MQAVCDHRITPRSSSARRLLHGRKGLSLIEVMIAFTVMVAVLCGALGALVSGYRSLDTARCSTLSAQILQSRVETLRLMNWTRLDAQVSRDFTTAELQSLVPPEAATLVSRFSLRQDITKDNAREVHTIVLTVRWQNVKGNAHERKFTMRYAKNGLYDYYVNTL